MTTTVDPGRAATQKPPHPGDSHAERIRQLIDRIKGNDVEEQQ